MEMLEAMSIEAQFSNREGRCRLNEFSPASIRQFGITLADHL
jgi:hypothetical protein